MPISCLVRIKRKAVIGGIKVTAVMDWNVRSG
jgi:hypothetical protein